MSHYLARVVSPSGSPAYLCHGREVSMRNATRYSSPSAAERAGRRYAQPKRWYFDVIDERDPERVLP